MSERTVGALLRARAATRGDQPLLVCDADRLSYAEAETRSARLARGLIALGAGKGTHVGVLYPNGSAFLVAMLAAARIGATVIPVSTLATARELREQLGHADVEILLSAASYRAHDYRQRLAEVGDLPLLRHVLIDTEPTELADAALLAALEDDVEPTDVLAIIYTSGSTSAPKGVVHTHAGLLDHQVVLNEIRGLTAQEKLFAPSPFFWVGGFAYSILAVMLAGATLLCSNAVDPGETLDLLEAEKPTMTNGFVGGIAHLARHPSLPRRDLSSLRRGNLYPIMAPEVRPADPELRHTMLGMTESGSVILAWPDESDQPEHRRGSFGKPVPGFEVRIVDPDTGALVPTGQTGELWVRGPFMMERYYKRSREECFDADGWFHTGDLVRTDADGFHYFVGRSSTMIKTAGANVAPAEVERAIAKVTGGLRSYVLGLPDADRGQIVAAVVAVEEGGPVFDEATVRERLRDELSSYKIPRRFAAVPGSRIPMMSSGKVDLKRLSEVFDG
ncbi:acyl-CoA synthetase [Mycolicibacterium phlei]|uniref:AMP-dependent synthetase and ligase n=2 Tax=Mycolicibacterium TaxID=1866885 RepID=A0A5N5UP76_MYCPH|nr:class I adenylate-forming enzyme family protein [Mycolicibacterium phlei]VEG08831.1 acyl-CoA synthetase [Mycobacteroides chelonae]AMO60712.1 Long-chain-fatty-acid--CoA ligase [Mycolicibacterium phlei]KAB7751414.1 AMP-dependent synthetase and ligase [Mycolicibacterium phlei DSM 43239 = CCUG 21000]KXW68055.1 AMP-dependent synthetase and ligase [Mycolicibacterium phlei DSM 43239 = CCUG 21000]KXW68291.1 AMP-dependent synthetase and ligase [Mycolicibacterium phlei DSM 43070]